ncbi:MAG: ferritin family protein [Deltaproteobacteria bacterium]|jgi:rubrerythrin|nr:ferritin family protein [Deltaproteobacteria bacterium]
MADAAIQDIAEALLQAMKAEHEGHHFYSMAAKTCEDPKGREVFTRLAVEEAEHLGFLKGQREALLRDGKVDATLSLGAPADLAGKSPIFSDELRGRVADAHFEMTALAVAVQLEQDAERFYREAAAKAALPDVRSFLERLAEWESGHYRALLAQQEELKEDYWSAAGFAPF